MKRIRSAIARHAVALVVLAAAWLLLLVVPGEYGVVAVAVVVAITGGVAAIVGPAHPLRNGLLSGLLLVVLLVLGLLGQVAMGGYRLAEGETWASFWMELPFWFLLFAVPAALLGLLGASVVTLVKLANQRMHPR